MKPKENHRPMKHIRTPLSALLVLVMLAAGTLPVMASEEEGAGPFQERIYLRSARYDEFYIEAPELLGTLEPGEPWPLESYLPPNNDQYEYGWWNGYDEGNAYNLGYGQHDNYELDTDFGFISLYFDYTAFEFSIPYTLIDPSPELQKQAQGDFGDPIARLSDFYEVIPEYDKEAYLSILQKYKDILPYVYIDLSSSCNYQINDDNWYGHYQASTLAGKTAYVQYEDSPDDENINYVCRAAYAVPLDRPIPIRYDLTEEGTNTDVNKLGFPMLHIQITLDTKLGYTLAGAHAKMDQAAAEIAAVPFHYNVYVRRIGPPCGDPVSTGNTFVDKDAEAEAGEDSGEGIPLAVVVGALGLLGAGGAAAAVALSRKKKTKGDRQETPDRYRLYVSKDFGNRLRKGGKSRELRARIEQISPDGTVHRRDDLSYNISFTGGQYIQTGEACTVDGSAAAAIRVDRSVPENVTEDSVCVTYIGEGGTFTERLRFQLVGDPYITFPEMADHALMMNLDVIGGDRRTYNVMFTLEDAEEQPKKITFSPEKPGLKLDHHLIEGYTYDAVIENRTDAVENRVYEIEERNFVEITAEFEDGTTVTNGFNVRIYPEGLSVQAKSRDGVMLIKSVNDKQRGELDYVIKPVSFKPILAIRKAMEDGTEKTVVVETDEAEASFEPLKAEQEITKTLLEKYEYVVDADQGGSGHCAFEPKTQIPSYYPPEDWEKRSPEDYEAALPMTVTYEGRTYRMDVPCLLIGEKLDPMGTWKEQYQRVVRAITRYAPDEMQDVYFNKLSRMMRSRSAQELRVMEKMILARAIVYYTDQSKKEAEFAEIMDWCVDASEWAKIMGDIAFSVAVIHWLKKAGLSPEKAALAEIFFTLCKDTLTTTCGKWCQHQYFGEPFDLTEAALDFNNIAKVGESVICSELSLAYTMSPVEMRKALYVLAGYSVYTAMKNYLDTVNSGKPDFMGSLLKTILDFTQTAVVALGMGTLGQYLRSPAFQRKLTNLFKTYLNDSLAKKIADGLLKDISQNRVSSDSSMLQDLYESCTDEKGQIVTEKWLEWFKTSQHRLFITDMINSDEVQAYLNGFFGLGVAKVISQTQKAAEFTGRSVLDAQRAVENGMETGRKVLDSLSNSSIDTKTTDGGEHIVITVPILEKLTVVIDLTVFFERAKDNLTEAVRYIYDAFWSFLPTVEKNPELPEDLPVDMPQNR